MATRAPQSSYFSSTFSDLSDKLWVEVPVSSIAYFRVAFGLLIFFSTIRITFLGWIDSQYIDTLFQFSYYGFDWVKPYHPFWVYSLFGLVGISSLFVALGLKYRVSIVLLFLSFTYIELLDKTYYLNHYYFISVVSFLLIWLPAANNYSLDASLNKTKATSSVPKWTVLAIQLILAIVYISAGIAKINSDWLIHALPLKIWLPAKDYLPIIGPIFQWQYTPYLFSWSGMLFDISIPFFLWWKKSRNLAYTAVIFFHATTGILFQIGVFPIVMIALTPIFFSPQRLEAILKLIKLPLVQTSLSPSSSVKSFYVVLVLLLLQIILPFRPLLYPGNMFWTEEGYRFGWRVMLAEKAGTATFYVKDAYQENPREYVIDNADYLNQHQEKQMAFQPDMILQYAHFIEEQMITKYGMIDPIVRCEAYVTYNARPSKLLIDPHFDLTSASRGFHTKKWILREFEP